jgi:hypothetical protein
MGYRTTSPSHQVDRWPRSDLDPLAALLRRSQRLDAATLWQALPDLSRRAIASAEPDPDALLRLLVNPKTRATLIVELADAGRFACPANNQASGGR